jgi:hypothetical protein
MLDGQRMCFTLRPGSSSSGFKKAVTSTLLLPAIAGMSGCLDFPQMIHLRAPLEVSAPVSDGRPSALPLQDVKLARIITVGPEYQVKYSSDLSSQRFIPTEYHSVPDVSISAPQLDLAGALELLGVGDRRSPARFIYSDNGESALKTPIKVTFSDIQEMQSDPVTILQMLRSHQVEPSVGILPPPARPSTPQDSSIKVLHGDELGTYLFAEVQMAKTIDILFPKDTSTELIDNLKRDPKFGSRIEIAQNDNGWDIRSPLVPPRIVSVGIVPLRPHHSKEPGFSPKMKQPTSEVDVAAKFGWFESLPDTNYSCESAHFAAPTKDPNTTPQLAITYLKGALHGSSVGEFTQQQGVGVVSNGSLLKSPEFEDQALGGDTDKHPFWSNFCPWDCVDGVVRQFVLFAGVNQPQIEKPSPQAGSDSVLDLIKFTSQPGTHKVDWPRQPSYFVLLYLYSRHKSNILDPIGTVQTTATAHVEVRLAEMKPCN